MDRWNERPILYITADTESLMAVREGLAPTGYVVADAPTGIAGVEAAVRDRPLLILVDLGLPDVDGYATVAILKTFTALAETPVLLVTPRTLAVEERERALIAGCEGSIEKPIHGAHVPGHLSGFLKQTGRSAIPTAAFQRLQERFVVATLDTLQAITKAKHSVEHISACRRRIDQVLDDLVPGPDLGHLHGVLPRLAAAIGAARISVEVSGPSAQTFEAGSNPPVGTWAHASIDLAGRSLGVVSALYADHAPTQEDESLLRVVARQLAPAIAHVQPYENEQRARMFLAVLAHELRTPLAPILSAVQIIAGAGGNAELLRLARTVIERQVRYQKRLLDDLLDLTRIEHGKIRLQLGVADARHIVSTAVEMIRPTIEERQHRLSVSLPDHAVMVTVDAVRTEQVVANLLANAAKYTPIGGDIAVRVEAVDALARITVQDSGEGISAEMLDRIFDPFMQALGTEPHARPAGLGIGLALTRRLVELHGGTIAAHSRGVGLGSEFVVHLALAAGQRSQQGQSEIRPDPIEPANVLVVEDDYDTREMLRLALEQAGHRVAVASTGGAAVEHVAHARPDVMLVDLGLPDFDGHEVAKRVRASLGTSVYLVALTGFGQPEDLQRAEAAGFDTHLLKPAAIDEITRVLATRRRAA